jgi:hypothetical protein
LAELDVGGRCIWKRNLKDWFHLDQDRYQWGGGALLNTVVKPRAPQDAGNFRKLNKYSLSKKVFLTFS